MALFLQESTKQRYRSLEMFLFLHTFQPVTNIANSINSAARSRIPHFRSKYGTPHTDLWQKWLHSKSVFGRQIIALSNSNIYLFENSTFSSTIHYLVSWMENAA